MVCDRFSGSLPSRSRKCRGLFSTRGLGRGMGAKLRFLCWSPVRDLGPPGVLSPDPLRSATSARSVSAGRQPHCHPHTSPLLPQGLSSGPKLSPTPASLSLLPCRACRRPSALPQVSGPGAQCPLSLCGPPRVTGFHPQTGADQRRGNRVSR